MCTFVDNRLFVSKISQTCQISSIILLAAMEELDGDEVRVSSRGRSAERDIVQVTPSCTPLLLWFCPGSLHVLLFFYGSVQVVYMYSSSSMVLGLRAMWPSPPATMIQYVYFVVFVVIYVSSKC